MQDSMSSASVAAINGLQVLDRINIPCWLHRPVPGEPYCNVKGESMNHTVDPRKSLRQVFTAVKADETELNIADSPFPLTINGEEVTAILSQTEDTFHTLNPEHIRAKIMQKQNPIHTYLFDQFGILISANLNASNKWRLQGVDDMTKFELKNLLRHDGLEQPDAAAAAIKAIFTYKQPLHRVAMCSENSKGQIKWTQYEMWPATDAAAMQPAVLVNTLDITNQRELELQLEDAKQQLLRQNVQLEAAKVGLEADQVRLQEQQAALRARLQQALNFVKAPRTLVDTATVADKAVSIMDTFLEGGAPNLEELIAVRNAMVKTIDLRQPMDLDNQLLQRSGMSMDVGQAMMDLLQGDSHSGAKRLMRMQSSGTNLLGRLGPSEPGSSRFNSSRRLSKDVSQKFCGPEWCEDLPTIAGTDLQYDDGTASKIETAIVPIVERMLQEAGYSWTFNVFDLADATNNRPLSTLAFYLLKGSGLLESYELREDTVACFLRSIEAGYQNNPYHSRTHAAGVLQMLHILLHNGLMQSGAVEGPMQLACYLSAICHDFCHPGLTNDYLIKTRSQTALIYNDISPLENMHASGSFQMAASAPEKDFAAGLPVDIRNALRASIIELILGTDMKKHFSMLSRFQALVPKKVAATVDTGNHPWLPTSSESQAQAPASCTASSLAGLAADQKLLVAQVALKAADIAHLSAPLTIHKRWTAQLTEEFFLQGDSERSLGLKISPLMDRTDSAGMVKSQVGFFEIVAIPLFKGLTGLVPGTQPILEGVMANYEYWRGVQQA
ncbi:hypothetical protein WJX84_002108 [Apatococcus fuscideae]|uniref:Phosphodiesterase n=1 Tax=Apatococcus fuscideae TaxID=2026836 RepID=A0AAW1TG37_9CHLO